jgi:hypothetical protein
MFVTGYADAGPYEDFLRIAPVPVVSKPFEITALRETVRRCRFSELAAVIKALRFCTAILDGVTGVDEKLDGHLKAHARPGASEQESAAGMLRPP